MTCSKSTMLLLRVNNKHCIQFYEWAAPCLVLPFLALLSEKNNSLSRSIVWLLEFEGEPKNVKPGK